MTEERAVSFGGPESYVLFGPATSVLYAIRNGEVATLENPAIEQLKIDLPLHLMKEGNA